jgi:hypothetical protein
MESIGCGVCAVGGARDSTILFRRKRSVESEAPSTILRAARYGWSPSPASRGRMRGIVLAARKRASLPSHDVKQPTSRTVIARSEATKQSRLRGRTGLLRGACHRAGHFGPDPLARNDERRKREAGRRQTQCLLSRAQAAHGSRHGECGLRRPPLAGALACRRSTTVLAAATERRGSAPANALPAAELGRSGCYPLPAAMRLSGFPRRPVIVPAGRIAPEPPESGGDEPPPAGTVPAPAARHHPNGVPQGGI